MIKHIVAVILFCALMSGSIQASEKLDKSWQVFMEGLQQAQQYLKDPRYLLAEDSGRNLAWSVWYNQCPQQYAQALHLQTHQAPQALAASCLQSTVHQLHFVLTLPMRITRYLEWLLRQCLIW